MFESDAYEQYPSEFADLHSGNEMAFLEMNLFLLKKFFRPFGFFFFFFLAFISS